jgi:glyoxylase-like metal-dependent hydrolase (beta-lactamase superfamily II)
MTASATTWLRLVCLVAAMLAGPPVIGQSSAPGPYEVYAVRFADVPFSAGSLVAGADRARMLDIAFSVWVMKGNGRTVLLDAGFYRDKFMERWKPRHYARPSDAVKAGLGIGPDQVTDIVVSHSHWDHADGVDLFPNATVWIQREEYEYYVGPSGEVLHTGGVDAEDAGMFAGLKSAGRVKLIDGDAREILPGLIVYTGGKHTFASQYVGVQTRAGVVVLASDNAYLYENLERRLAIAQTLDAEANLAAQARMLRMAAAPKFVIPGHDPAVFDRFPAPGNGVARIE